MARAQDAAAPARPLAALGAIVALAAATELAMGRKPWGVAGHAGLWSGDVDSPRNSQFAADPYSFTHIGHGLLLYAALGLVARRSSLWSRALAALALESLWEVIENTDAVIERYRAATISLHYYGDSVVNSVCDILFCGLGFYLASKLPSRWSAALFVAIELVLLAAIRDGLILNILMLIHPIPALKAWQLRAP